MDQRLLISVADISTALQAQVQDFASAYFQRNGVSPRAAATASFLREGHLELGLDYQYDDRAADIWDGAEAAISEAFGFSACELSLSD